MYDIFIAGCTFIGVCWVIFLAVILLFFVVVGGWAHITAKRQTEHNAGFRVGHAAGLASVSEIARWFGEYPAVLNLLSDVGVGLHPNQIRDNWKANTDRSKMYFEAHVTTDPVPENLRAKYLEICQENGFHVASLLMEKPGEGLVSYDGDAFCTSRGSHRSDLEQRTIRLLHGFAGIGLVIRRYKIEDTVLDSRVHNVYKFDLKGPKAAPTDFYKS